MGSAFCSKSKPRSKSRAGPAPRPAMAASNVSAALERWWCPELRWKWKLFMRRSAHRAAADEGVLLTALGV